MTADMTRRTALRLGVGTALGATALAAADPVAAAAARRARRRTQLLRGGTFPTGVISGAPLTDGAVLMTRVDGIERAGLLEIEVSSDPDFRRVLLRQRTRAAPIRDYCAKRLVRSSKLRPGEQYWYRFVTRDGSSPVGRFRTALPPDSREPVRIGFFSCQKWHQGYFTAHAGLAAEDDLDLVVSLGDYVYEEPAERRLVEDRRDETGALGDGDVQSLAEYRQKYRLYQSDEHLRAMHAAHPFVAIWDDHEAEDDYAADHEGDPLRERRVPFAERRRAGYLSFFEHLPMPRFRDDGFRLYRSMRVGQAEIFMLDTRQYRDALACPSASPCPQAGAPGRSILGERQRRWLGDGLRDSRAAWKVIANQVMMMGLDVPTGIPFNADQWDGYAAERQSLLEEALRAGVQDITVLTGDIHTFFAGTVTTTGRIGGTPAATEFIGGSITSTGIRESVPADPVVTENGLRAMNPHIEYVEVSSRGYGVMEVRPDELVVTYRRPRTVFEPRSQVEDLARFRVGRGSTRVERT